MPVLNSVQLWGRYKQQFNEETEVYSIYHVCPDAGQTYINQEGWLYRHVTWVYGYPNLDKMIKYSGAVIYCFNIPKAFRKALINFRDAKNKLLALSPWQVLKFVGQTVHTIPPEGENLLRTYSVVTFEVCDDYKNHVKWSQLKVSKGITQ